MAQSPGLSKILIHLVLILQNYKLRHVYVPQIKHMHLIHLFTKFLMISRISYFYMNGGEDTLEFQLPTRTFFNNERCLKKKKKKGGTEKKIKGVGTVWKGMPHKLPWQNWKGLQCYPICGWHYYKQVQNSCQENNVHIQHMKHPKTEIAS